MSETSLRVPATSEGLKQVTAAFDAFGAANDLSHPLMQAGQVALDELLSNTIRAGFPSGEAGHIAASFTVLEGILEIQLIDDGVPFNPLLRSDPDTKASLEARPVGGLGIYFVKQLMDEVVYERAGHENRLRLRKRIIGGS